MHQRRGLYLITHQRLIEGAFADRGSGFRVACPEQLFEPFYTTKPHGMGLGLSIVRSIVEAHDGRVSAALRGGGGAQIVVWLPLVEGAHRTAVSAGDSADDIARQGETAITRASRVAGEGASS